MGSNAIETGCGGQHQFHHIGVIAVGHDEPTHPTRLILYCSQCGLVKEDSVGAVISEAVTA